MDIRIKKLSKKLTGFHRLNRDRFFLLRDHALSANQLVLYEILIAITDWDSNHEDYGVCVFTNESIAYFLGCKSDSTISRRKMELIKKGFLEPLGGDRFKVKGFEKFLPPRPAKKQNDSSEMHSQSDFMQEESAELQNGQFQKHQSPLGSFKDNLSSFDEKSNHSEEIDLDDLPF